MSVNLGRAKASVTEKLLYIADIDPIFQKMCRKRMPKSMERYILADARASHGILEDMLQRSDSKAFSGFLPLEKPALRPVALDIFCQNKRSP